MSVSLDRVLTTLAPIIIEEYLSGIEDASLSDLSDRSVRILDSPPNSDEALDECRMMLSSFCTDISKEKSLVANEAEQREMISIMNGQPAERSVLTFEGEEIVTTIPDERNWRGSILGEWRTRMKNGPCCR